MEKTFDYVKTVTNATQDDIVLIDNYDGTWTAVKAGPIVQIVVSENLIKLRRRLPTSR